jgi:positive regulator of sigma E activity
MKTTWYYIILFLLIAVAFIVYFVQPLREIAEYLYSATPETGIWNWVGAFILIAAALYVIYRYGRRS